MTIEGVINKIILMEIMTVMILIIEIGIIFFFIIIQ
jgi:hypothetical protein